MSHFRVNSFETYSHYGRDLMVSMGCGMVCPWMINAAHVDKVTKNGKLKGMAGKARQIAHAATLTFNVR